METFFNSAGRKSLRLFIAEHRPLVENYVSQFSRPTDAKKNLLDKFKSEYKKKNPKSKRGPPLTVEFDTLWSSVQVEKAVHCETNKISVALVKASGQEITKRLEEDKSIFID